MPGMKRRDLCGGIGTGGRGDLGLSWKGAPENMKWRERRNQEEDV